MKKNCAAWRVGAVCVLVCWLVCSCGGIEPEQNQRQIDSTFLHLGPISDEPMGSAALDYLFDIESLPTITLMFSEREWNRYLTNYADNKDNRKYILGRFVFEKDGKTYYRDKIGMRPRGNTSRVCPEGAGNGNLHRSQNSDYHHTHFGINFTKYDSASFFMGADRMVLKCFKCDPAYCREVFSYDLLKRFGVWTAPRIAYCRLYIYIDGDDQPVYFGVYAMIEGVRDGFLADRHEKGLIQSESGNLWKANPWFQKASFYNPDPQFMGVETEQSAAEHSFNYTLKTNKSTGLQSAQSELSNFITKLRNHVSGTVELKQWLERNLDVETFLRYEAVCAITGSWDDYWNRGNNFYFYFDSDHKMYIIPYDFDNTLGNCLLSFDSGTHDVLNWGGLGNEQILMERVLSIPEYKQMYMSMIRQLLADDELFGINGSRQRVVRFQSLVSSLTANDTGEDMYVEDKPVSWSETQFYRLLSGDSITNFFLAKHKSVNF